VDRGRARQLQDLRYRAALLSVFGLVAILLSIVGLFGVLARASPAVRDEIGIRMALGAPPRSIVGLFAQQGLISRVSRSWPASPRQPPWRASCRDGSGRSPRPTR